MSLVIGELVKSATGPLAVFDTAQLEAELARRKRTRADTDPTTRPAVIDPIFGHSVETAIKLEDSDSDEEIKGQIEHLSNSETKNGRDSDSGGEHERKNGRITPPPPPSRRRRATRPRGPKEPPLALYKAHIKSLADAGTARVTSSTSDIDNSIIQRIKKCLDRAHHPSTPQAESKAAIYVASRLMGQYNVSQAEVLAHEPPTAQRQYGGQSVASLRRTDGDVSKAVRHCGYVDVLCAAMSTFFDCNCFSTEGHSSLELTFYGIAENTVVAAMSFEMAFNLISEWARHQKGLGKKYSYYRGASDELRRMADQEKAAEEAKAKETEEEALAAKVKQEELERQAEIDRLAVRPETANERASPGPTEEADTAQVNDEEILSWDDARSTMPSDGTAIRGDNNETDEDDGDYIEPDFTVESEHGMDLEANLDEEIQMHIRPDPPILPRSS